MTIRKKRRKASKLQEHEHRIEYLPLDTVVKFPGNPKDHDIDGIDASMQRYGLVALPTIDETTGRLVAGHGRLETIRNRKESGQVAPRGVRVRESDGAWLIPVVRGISFESPAEAEAYLLSDNRLTEKGGWDNEALVATARGLLDRGISLEGTGFTTEEIDEIARSLTAEIPDDTEQKKFPATGKPIPNVPADDEIPDDIESVTKPGDDIKIGRHRVVCADCIDVLREMPDDSIDAVVCDPPYGISFNDNPWDTSPPTLQWARECLRVLKPGGHLVAFAAPRTYHRLAYAADTSGFEIRDMLSWLFWTGIPKSLNVSKAIDRLRDDRDQILEVTKWIRERRDELGIKNSDLDEPFGFKGMAGHWTTSKSQPTVPTLEQVPKILEVLKVDTPPPRIQTLLLELNGRKGQPGPNWLKRAVTGRYERSMSRGETGMTSGKSGIGKERRDIAASEEAKKWDGWGTNLKPAKEPILLARKPMTATTVFNVLKHGTGAINVDACRYADGDAAWPGPQGNDPGVNRFPSNVYACPKPPRSERESGTEGLQTSPVHPTVKPVRLMRWLVRLVTPPGGVVLDTYLGSGTTAVAAEREGFRCVGVESEPKYVDIAAARLRSVAALDYELEE